MTALPGIIGLIVFLYVRPHEFWKPLQSIPFLYLFLALAVIGAINDYKKRRSFSKNLPKVQFKWVYFLFFWCIGTILLKNPGQLIAKGVTLLVALIIYLIMVYGIQSVDAFQKSVVILFACGLWVAGICFHQRFTP